MKKSFIIAILFSVTALAGSADLTLEDFMNNDLFKYVFVEKAEMVFDDELTGELLYQVTYLVEGECAPSGEGDACEMVQYCEYVWVDQNMKDDDYYMEGTQQDCSIDIEDILRPNIIDEL